MKYAREYLFEGIRKSMLPKSFVKVSVLNSSHVFDNLEVDDTIRCITTGRRAVKNMLSQTARGVYPNARQTRPMEKF